MPELGLDVLRGLTPARKVGSGYNNGGGNWYPITNGYNTNIGEGDPVKISAGNINIADNLNKVIGTFAQVAYIDAEDKLQFKRNFVAGTSSKGTKVVFGGFTQPMALVYDDPEQTFIVRTATSSLASAGMVGRSFKLSAIGSVVNGRSQAILDVSASVGTSGGHMVTVVGLYTGRNSRWGTAPTAVEVKLSNPGYVNEL